MKRSLESISEEIDAFPFDQLPIDLIVKIFLESQFTVKELHRLCNLNKKIKKICNDRKIWEQIFFRKVMGKDREMKIAEKNGTLPELMEKLRKSENYKLWNLMTSYEPFVVLIAFFLFLHRGIIYLMKGSENLSIQFNSNIKSISNVGTAENRKKIEKLILTCFKNVSSNAEHTMYQCIDSSDYLNLQFFYNVVMDGWVLFFDKGVDNVPLECSICSKVKDLKKCSCCEQIYCSVNCQIKNH